MPTVPRLTCRYDHFIEMVIRDRQDVSAYRFGAANTLNTAFSGVTPMFTVPRGGTFRSPTVVRKRLGMTQYTNREITVVHYDPEDFWLDGGTMPHDMAVSYVRIEEKNAAGAFRPAGPILIVPQPGFFATTRPSITVAGTAPNVAASSTGLPPEGALHFVLPRFADALTIGNRGAASLFVSFNPGQPEFEITTGVTLTFPDGAISEVLIRGNGATVAFNVYCAIVNAEMA